MMTNVEKFRIVYTDALAAAVARKPAEYAFKLAEVPLVAEKMVAGLRAGTAHVGPAVKHAARKLGIPGTLHGVREYLLKDSAVTP